MLQIKLIKKINIISFDKKDSGVMKNLECKLVDNNVIYNKGSFGNNVFTINSDSNTQKFTNFIL